MFCPTHFSRHPWCVHARVVVTAALSLFFALGPCATNAQTPPDEFPGLRAVMSADDFRRFGLDTLEPAQLQALDRWMHGYLTGREASQPGTDPATPTDPSSASAAATPRASDDIGLPRRAVAKRDEQLTARLSDDFQGWEGNTLFKLDNGQIWRQRMSGRYRYRGPANPQVIIKRNFLGFFQMTLVEEDRGIGVTRVR